VGGDAPQPSRSRLVAQLALATLVVIAAAWQVYARVLRPEPAAAASPRLEDSAAARVTAVHGVAEREVDGVWKPLAAGDRLGRTEVVRTAADSRLTVDLSGTVVEVDPLTRLSIEEVTALLRRLRLQQGRIVAEQTVEGVTLVVENQRGATARSTARARFTVRDTGAVFAVATETGEVNLAAAGASVRLPAGQLSLVESGAPTSPSPVPAELLLKLAARVADEEERCVVEATVPAGAEVSIAGSKATLGAGGVMKAEVPGTPGTRVAVEVRDVSGRAERREVECVAGPVKLDAPQKINWK